VENCLGLPANLTFFNGLLLFAQFQCNAFLLEDFPTASEGKLYVSLAAMDRKESSGGKFFL
jgi:hypothetical protein